MTKPSQNHIAAGLVTICLLAVSCTLGEPSTDKAPPAVPTDLVATAAIANDFTTLRPTYHLVNLSWKDNSSEEDGFLLEYTQDNSPSQEIDLQANTLTYIHKYKAPGAYTYTITAYVDHGIYGSATYQRIKGSRSVSAFVTVQGVCAVANMDIGTLTTSSAVVSSAVTFDGGAAVTERGIVFSTHFCSRIDIDPKVVVGLGTGPFSTPLGGLTPATTYYVRGYAINSYGTSYGLETTFVTN